MSCGLISHLFLPNLWNKKEQPYSLNEHRLYHKYPLGGRKGVLDPPAAKQLKRQCENETHYKSRLKGYKESE